MTREAEAAFKAWIVSVGGASLDEAYSAGHAAADTDATRRLARMAALAEFWGPDNPDPLLRLCGETLRAIVEE